VGNEVVLMRDIITALIVFGSLPFILRYTYIGVLIWSWIGYMNPHRLGWGFARDYPFAYIIALVTLVSFLFNREKKVLPLNGVTIVWFMFLFWMVITTVFSIYPDDALIQLIKVAKIQLFAILTLLFFGDIKRINMLVWVIVISLSYFGVKGGIFTILHGGSFIVWGPPGTFIEGNNELALALLMVIPLMNYLREISENKWIKRGLLVGMLLMGASALGSQSRGALLAGTAMLLWLWSKSKNKMVSGVAMVIVAIALISFMPESWHKRMDTIETYEEDASAMGRINAWFAAYNLAKEHVFGGGFDGINHLDIFQAYAPNPFDYHDAHSIYFEVLGDHGFIGLFLFLLMGVLAWKMAGSVIKDTEGIKELYPINMLARMLQVSLIAYATGGAFLGLAYFDLYYHLIVLTILCWWLTKNYKPKSTLNT
jgi:probable O-glycosylation ligase (exosortase A-associated)